MSLESSEKTKRPYRKRRRAELEQETRWRITEAAVELHGSVGPARTTVKAVAELAGVQRATVYRHFPDDEALFAACSAHWSAEHPMPDLEEWAAIDDPAERLATALAELYLWYEQGEDMLERTTRDAAVVPAMQPVMEEFGGWFGEAADVLMRGRLLRGPRRRRVAAAIGHSLGFGTWRSLTREQGLDRDEAAGLMAGLVAGVSASS